ncbi:MAG: single-stranded DNA-binding protein [Brevibacterium aurantiacum]|nr:single-stranded DNA-binding protein [Brevibacterium aurantiacum]
MANEQHITIRGRLTSDPELKFTPNGKAVANFTIAQNARYFDKQTNEFKDKEAIFWRCSAWQEMAENIAETLHKGSPVVAFAELESRSFETKEGDKRTVTEARIEAIGPDLRWVAGQFQKPQRGQQQQGGNFGGQQQGGFQQSQQGQQGGNWGNQQQAQQSSGWGQNPGGNDVEPNF